ncbi:anti-sigma factor family protein [Desulfurispora thermophila]|uniref:anti-sigma factor family protein n=1 Tax=Desulfurispora thermophila TaxID=265470 RepID=UPI00037A0EBF|nr:zf-HC2 domain-containing protein [Desulfurispora thermophila]
MCYNAGTLQAYLDGELPVAQKQEVEQHLQSCPRCREQLGRLEENLAFARSCLADYAVHVSRIPVQTGTAWQKLLAGEGVSDNNWRKGGTMLTRCKKAVTVAAGIALLGGAFSLQPVRGFAENLLQIFRVEKIQTVQVSADDLSQLRQHLEKSQGEFQLENLGEFKVAHRPQNSKLTLAAAQKQAAFPFRVIQGYEPYVEYVNKEGANQFSFKLRVDQANAILKALGGTYLLPEELNGREFTITLPDSYHTVYKDPQSQSTFTYTQMPAPELVVPRGVDVAALRQALLELPFLPDNLRRQLAAVQDWQHTALIPVMEGQAREVEVDGTRGVYFSGQGEAAGTGTLIWQKDGVSHMLHGHLSLEKCLELAEKLK